MISELISKKTRNEFREFLVNWTLREIGMEFEAANVDCDSEYDPQISGERRTFVEQHYHTLDFKKPADVRRLLAVYENILNCAERCLSTQQNKLAAERAIESLITFLMKDGFRYQNGKIAPIALEMRKVFDENAPSRSVSEFTRQNIFDELRIAKVPWSGQLSESKFHNS